MQELEKEQEEKLAKIKKLPHIINLNEDKTLDRKQAYGLTDGEGGKIIVGRKNANPEAHIVLGGIGIQKNHAYFTVDKHGAITLHPFSD